MTKKERTFLAEGLKKLCADIAAIACAIEGDEIPEAKPEPTAEKARAPEKARSGKTEAMKKAEDPEVSEKETVSTPPLAEAAVAEKRAEGQGLPEKEVESTHAVPEKAYTFEEVRGILAEKSRSGFRAEVKGLLAKRHVNQLSEITDPEELAQLVREAEGIGIG